MLQVNFFAFVAQEVRMGLARLGMRSLDELVGRADLLRQKSDLQLGKTSHLDMSFLTTYAGHEPGNSTQRRDAKVSFEQTENSVKLCRDVIKGSTAWVLDDCWQQPCLVGLPALSP